jgi:hypothetical protein
MPLQPRVSPPAELQVKVEVTGALLPDDLIEVAAAR